MLLVEARESGLSGQGETMTENSVIPWLDQGICSGNDRVGQGETMTGHYVMHRFDFFVIPWRDQGIPFHNRLPCRGTTMTHRRRLSGQDRQ